MKYLVAALAGALALALIRGGYERHQHTSWRDYAKRLEKASQVAAEATKAMRVKERTEYQEKADNADQHHAQAVADARSATAAYISRQRVRPYSSSPAQPVSEAGIASVPEGLPADPVMVGSADVQACGEWVAYGAALREWALSVGE